MQYGSTVRLLGISQVEGLVIHDALSISSHLAADAQKPHRRAVLHIHPPQHPVGRGADSRPSLSTFSAITQERLRVVRADFTQCQWHLWPSYHVQLDRQLDS